MDPPRLPQEIWDEILGNLYGTNRCTDLRSSALVCRAFVASAQRHLFRRILIHSFYFHLDHRMKAIAPDELAPILSESPHLITYIHKLYVGKCDLETLTAILQIPWSHLDDISLVWDLDHRYTWELRPPYPHPLFQLISLPTLRKITFCWMRWESSTLFTVLSRCNPEIRCLEFRECEVRRSSIPSDVVATAELPRLRITHLALWGSGAVANFLMDPACPVDLSRLKQVMLRDQRSVDAPLNALLRRGRDTIEVLGFDSREQAIQSLDLTRLPVLSHIRLFGVGNPDALQKLLRDTNKVQTISYCVSFRESSFAEYYLRDLRGGILASQLPSLQRVEVVIMDLGAFRTSGAISSVREQMSEIDRRGLLVVLEGCEHNFSNLFP